MIAPSTILADLEAAGLPVPPEVLYAVEAVAEAEAFRCANPNELNTQLRADVAARAVRPENLPSRMSELAVAYSTGAHRQDPAQAVIVEANALARNGVAARGDTIVAALRPRFDAAAAIIARSLEPNPGHGMGFRPTAPFVSMPTPERNTAAAELGGVRSVRLMLGACGYGRPDETASWYIRRPDDRDGLTLANSVLADAELGLEFVDLAAWGSELRLATAEEIDKTDKLIERKPPVDLLAR